MSPPSNPPVGSSGSVGLPTAGRVLIVDADGAVTEPLTYLLQQAGFAVVVVSSGPAALAEFADHGADTVLLDLDLDLSGDTTGGLDVCERLRAASSVPIIVLTASDLEADKVAALELGADDYLTKPFSSRELIARMGAVQRRYDNQDRSSVDAVVTAGPVRIDVQRHRVNIHGVEVALRLKEFVVLEFLVRNRGRVVSRGQLIERIWGENFDGDPKRADAIINRLRAKLEADAAVPRHLLTVRGLGYRFEP